MITRFFKVTLSIFIVVSMLVGCDGNKPLGMNSEDSIMKIKELVKANVNIDENKIYELEWEEDNGDNKLENILSSITVYYIDKDNNGYHIIIRLENGGFVADMPKRDEMFKYSYEKSKAINLDDINIGLLERITNEGYDLFMVQEGNEQYELKSVERYRFYISPVREDSRGLFAKNESYNKEHTTMMPYFDLNFIKKDEEPEYSGRHILTNYYTVSFKVNEDGKVEIY